SLVQDVTDLVKGLVFSGKADPREGLANLEEVIPVEGLDLYEALYHLVTCHSQSCSGYLRLRVLQGRDLLDLLRGQDLQELLGLFTGDLIVGHDESHLTLDTLLLAPLSKALGLPDRPVIVVVRVPAGYVLVEIDLGGHVDAVRVLTHCTGNHERRVCGFPVLLDHVTPLEAEGVHPREGGDLLVFGLRLCRHIAPCSSSCWPR